MLLVSCGFHLRGTAGAVLPAQLTAMRVTVADSQLAHDPLRLAMVEALRTRAAVRIEETGEAPQLVLSGERLESEVLSVGAGGKVSEYLIKYEVSFRLADGAGAELLAPQTVRIQRDHRFDPLNVLARERELEELKRDMRRDAAGQIVRRLAKLKMQNAK